MGIPKAYEEIIELIARGSNAQTISDFQPSDDVRRRVQELIDQEKEGILAPEERSELDHYMQLEHLMRLAKARAKQHLAAA